MKKYFGCRQFIMIVLAVVAVSLVFPLFSMVSADEETEDSSKSAEYTIFKAGKDFCKEVLDAQIQKKPDNDKWKDIVWTVGPFIFAFVILIGGGCFLYKRISTKNEHFAPIAGLVVIIPVLIILAIGEDISKEAVVALLGAVVGYFFNRVESALKQNSQK